MTESALILTCDQATGYVPASLRRQASPPPPRYSIAEFTALRRLTRGLAERLGCGWARCDISPSVLDVRRNQRRSLFPLQGWNLSEADRSVLIARHYVPYRFRVLRLVRDLLRTHASVLHVTLTGALAAAETEGPFADMGLLYDPRRPGERRLAVSWQARLRAQRRWCIRRNWPRRGHVNGLGVRLRRRFGPEHYRALDLALSPRLVASEDRVLDEALLPLLASARG